MIIKCSGVLDRLGLELAIRSRDGGGQDGRLPVAGNGRHEVRGLPAGQYLDGVRAHRGRIADNCNCLYRRLTGDNRHRV